jgi:hypothetical protein
MTMGKHLTRQEITAHAQMTPIAPSPAVSLQPETSETAQPANRRQLLCCTEHATAIASAAFVNLRQFFFYLTPRLVLIFTYTNCMGRRTIKCSVSQLRQQQST